jgi:hypothetical protein
MKIIRSDVPVSAALLVALVALACPGEALQAGNIYKSVDAQGQVTYSDQPDMSVPQTQVAIAGINSYAATDIRTDQAPPPLQAADQPPCPEDGYVWTPGYWAWGAAGYYWVAGEWVAPPQVGLLWTPGYWEYLGNAYVFHPGYWAADVGYYGGIDYGYGYFGAGYVGGRWWGNSFAYNRGISNLGRRPFRNVYSEPANDNGARNRVSYSPQRAHATQSHLAPAYVPREYVSTPQNPRVTARAIAAQPKPSATHSATTARAAASRVVIPH